MIEVDDVEQYHRHQTRCKHLDERNRFDARPECNRRNETYQRQDDGCQRCIAVELAHGLFGSNIGRRARHDSERHSKDRQTDAKFHELLGIGWPNEQRPFIERL